MTSSGSGRINARLPPELARKTAYLERRLNLTTTQVVREALERFYASVHEGPADTAELLEDAGFVACTAGPEDLSSTYKAELTRSLEPKRGRRTRRR